MRSFRACLGRWMPGVSRKASWTSPRFTTPSTLVRVVWGIWLVAASFWPSRAFNRVDLPALGRPMMARVAWRFSATMHAPFGVADELQQVGHLSDVAHFLLGLGHGLVPKQSRVEEETVSLLQPLDDLHGKTLALQTNGVHAVALGVPGAGGLHERQHVLGGNRAAAHEGVVPNTAELVDRRKGADIATVTHLDVARQGGAVGEDVLAAHVAVMGDVGPGHQEVVVAQGGEAAAALGPAVEGAALADHVPVAHHQAGRCALELQVLGTHAQGGVGIDVVVLAELGVGTDDDMAAQLGAGTDDSIAFDDTEGAHDHALAQSGLRAHHAARMDLSAHRPSPSARSISMDMNSASATFWPSTKASPRILQIRPLSWITLTSITIWSPGRTGLRNFTPSIPMK